MSLLTPSVTENENSQVSHTDVTSRLSSILTINWGDVDEVVGNASAGFRNSVYQVLEGHVCADCAIACRARIVLDLLHKDKIRSFEVVCNMVCDIRDVAGIIRRHVFDLVIPELCI